MRFQLYSIPALFFLIAPLLWGAPSDYEQKPSTESTIELPAPAANIDEDLVRQQFERVLGADTDNKLTDQQKKTVEEILHLTHKAARECTDLLNEKKRKDAADEKDVTYAFNKTVSDFRAFGIQDPETEVQKIKKKLEERRTNDQEKAPNGALQLPQHMEILLKSWVTNHEVLELNRVTFTDASGREQPMTLFLNTHRIPQTESSNDNLGKTLDCVMRLLQDAYNDKTRQESAKEEYYQETLDSREALDAAKSAAFDFFKKDLPSLPFPDGKKPQMISLLEETAKALGSSEAASSKVIESMRNFSQTINAKEEHRKAQKLQPYTGCMTPLENRPAYISSFAAIYEQLIQLVPKQTTKTSSDEQLESLFRELCR